MCMCVTELEISGRATGTGGHVHLHNCATHRRGRLLESGPVCACMGLWYGMKEQRKDSRVLP